MKILDDVQLQDANSTMDGSTLVSEDGNSISDDEASSGSFYSPGTGTEVLADEATADELVTSVMETEPRSPPIDRTTRPTFGMLSESLPAQPEAVDLTASGIIASGCRQPRLSVSVPKSLITNNSSSPASSTEYSPSSPPCPAKCVTDLVRRTGEHPFAQGGFSDVWCGELDSQDGSSTEKVSLITPLHKRPLWLIYSITSTGCGKGPSGCEDEK